MVIMHLVDVKHILVDVADILMGIKRKIWIYLGCQAMLMFFGCVFNGKAITSSVR